VESTTLLLWASEETFCQNQRLPPDVIDTTWSAPSLVDLIENIGLALRIHDLAPIGMAHQFEQQRDAARRVLYVQGGCLCSLLFEITAPLGNATQSTRFSELELRICQTSLLQATQRAALPTIFGDAITGIASQHLNLLQILRRVRTTAVAPSEAGSGSFPSHNVISSRALVQSLGTPWSIRFGTRLSLH